MKKIEVFNGFYGFLTANISSSTGMNINVVIVTGTAGVRTQETLFIGLERKNKNSGKSKKPATSSTARWRLKASTQNSPLT